MKRKILTSILVVLVNLSNIKAQKWTVFNTDNSSIVSNGITDIAIDAQNNKWITTYFGISKFNGANWTTYDQNNSGLVSNYCNALEIDINGNIWVGTEYGISKFNGSIWTTYLPIPFGGGPARTRVLSITSDSKGIVYFGHPDCFVSKFDGTNWTTFGISTPLANNDINSMEVDGEDNLWFSVFGFGLMERVGTTLYRAGNRFDQLLDNEVSSINISKQKGIGWFGSSLGLTLLSGSTWTQYSFVDNDIFPYAVSSIAIDKQGNNWFGWENGLSKFDGSTWTTLNTSNSGIPYNRVSKIVIESNGTIWLGNNGLVKYNPNDKTEIDEVKISDKLQLYPNPVINRLHFSNIIPNTFVSIYNIQGQQIMSQQLDGNELDVSGFTAGVYTIKIVQNSDVLFEKFIKQ